MKEEDNEIILEIKKKEVNLDKIKGSLWGGAIGDALGYPVEFMSESRIHMEYGKDGITEYDYDLRSGKALISDDTQMTLFTANGILWGETRGRMRGIAAMPHDYVAMSYEDWLCTQECTQKEFEDRKKNGYQCWSWLCSIPELFSRRAPGNTCLSALKSKKYGSLKNRINDSKGCGGIMRVAPLALHYSNLDMETLDMEGAEIAAITHGHSLGYIPAAVLTHILSRIIYPDGERKPLRDIVEEAEDFVIKLFEGDENLGILTLLIDLAISLSENDESDIENIRKLGEGWVAEETLAISIYCSLRHQDDFSKGVIAAVNHDGDSDSTGAVTGNILGALLGFDAIEEKWKRNLELSEILDEMSVDLCHGCLMSEYDSYRDGEWVAKYIEINR